jgi:UDP-N-acetylmuramate dehydrogenase
LNYALRQVPEEDRDKVSSKRAVERIEEIEAIARATDAQCRTWQWLKNFTALGVGGPVAAIIYPSTLAGAARLVESLRQVGIRWRALGHGTSILASDEVHDYVVISLRLLDERLVFDGERVRVHAGYSLPALVQAAAERGLSGFEGLSGISGGVGGALKMNAGTAGYEIWRVVEEVALAYEGKVRNVPAAEVLLEDGQSCLTDDDLILAATFRLAPGDTEEIKLEMDRLDQERLASLPSVGGASRIFKDAETDSTGRIIDQLGLKGKTHGGARVSETHAEFIVNEGSATADDVFELTDMIRERAKQERGLELEYEIDVWRDEAEG